MKYSQALIKTFKETPREANSINQALLERGSFVYQVGAGIFGFLPLGYRVYDKIRKLIVEELEKIGCQEVFLPILHPVELWKKSGRFDEIGNELLKVSSSKDDEFVLAMTHEEVITPLVKSKISSYSDLPFTLNQISKKIRNEPRPRGGLIRLKEFNMQDAYSFHATAKQLDKTFDDFVAAYLKIFERLMLKTVIVEASSGIMGGADSKEFMLINEAGEDKILLCSKCNKAFNLEVAPEDRKCPNEGECLNEEKAIELAHVFKLGSKYSDSFDLQFVGKDGKSKLVLMGCYGIGLDRLIASIVEESHDERGIIWPDEVSPFKVYLIDLTGNKADKVYDELIKSGIDVLYDDREVSAGVKFADADLLGITWRAVISEKTGDKIEIKKRDEEKSSLQGVDKFIEQLRK